MAIGAIPVIFAGRRPMPDTIRIGLREDNEVETIRFALPAIGSGQKAYLYMTLPGGGGDIVDITGGMLTITRTHTASPGVIDAHVEIVSGAVSWHSEPMRLMVADTTRGGEQVMQAYPSVIADALADIESAKTDAIVSIEEKMDEQMLRIPEMTALSEDVSALKDDLGNIKTITTSKNLLDMSAMVKGYLNGDGTLVQDNETYKTSDYISVIAGKTVYASRKYNTGNILACSMYRIVAYDATKNIVNITTTIGFNNYTIPSDAKYIRASINVNYLNSFGVQLEYDGVTTWEDYSTVVTVSADVFKEDGKKLSEIYAPKSDIIQSCVIGNVLYGKRLLLCGDSITFGYNADERNQTDETVGTYVNTLSPDNVNWKENTVLKKTFGYYIGERNKMTVAINAVSGSTMAENANSAQDGYAPAPFSRTNTTAGQNRYVDAIADGADYCLLWFGANDSTYYADGKMVIGTSADTTNKSEWGAWNLILSYYRTNYPNTKIGIIIPWCTELAIRECIRNVGKYWGIPVLDWMGDTQVPLMTAYGRDGETVNSELLTLIENEWYHGSASNDKMHPNNAGYMQMSTVIEDFLREL